MRWGDSEAVKTSSMYCSLWIINDLLLGDRITV